MISFKQYMLNEAKKLSYNNWRMLTTKEIKFEYMVEYPKLKPAYGDVFPTETDFIRAVKNAKPKTIDPSFDDRIGYRSQSWSLDSLKDLVSTYQYPRDVDRIVDGYKTNAKMPYPIVIKKGNRYRVMGGNTRMDVAFILGFYPKALIVEV